MWKREIDGRLLTFHLAGINNQNFLMRDEETGSFWQQISGRAVSGPMAGRSLELIACDELSFGLWRTENSRGSVLLPVAQFEKEYEPKDWERRMLKARSVIDTSKTGTAARTLMFGIDLDGVSRAYPVDRVLEQKLVQDRLGSQPLILVVGPDGKSVRAFFTTEGADFYRTPSGVFMDSETGSEWNFKGCATSGKAAGRCLRPATMIKDYWFDWHLYHPKSTIYSH